MEKAYYSSRLSCAVLTPSLIALALREVDSTPHVAYMLKPERYPLQLLPVPRQRLAELRRRSYLDPRHPDALEPDESTALKHYKEVEPG